ncbi:hypothetical protein AJ80_04302 [Polytolypa hystricis UAMH7299]|uniref:Glutaminase n=1 Tax=Polytolypa hystricis (strain UAMH7299) TaxID=1447883 RepID=A0A2B7Y448_POLH7|nr:hypothetical protein AJ80_04302 [Polytolypa hystricis UAMH7299]
MQWIVFSVLVWGLSQSSEALASRLKPPVLPLIVRNPYLSTWLGNARKEPWSKWPMFWTGEEIGLSLMAAVPDTGQVYPLLGRPQDSLLPTNSSSGYNVSYPIYVGAKYDASITNLTYMIPPPRRATTSPEPLEITLSFLSPITPTSTLRQSLPAAYVTVHVKGNMNVNIYMDVNGQWVSGDRGSQISWKFDHLLSTRRNSTLLRWQVKRNVEMLLSEIHDRAEWGTLHFVAPEGTQYESGTSALLRKHFASTGILRNSNDGVFRSIMDQEPVFAFSKSFTLDDAKKNRHKEAIEESVTFSLALVQDPVVKFASARGLTYMKPLWKSWFPTTDRLLSFHQRDFDNARKLAAEYSDRLAVDAYFSGAEDYVDIVGLSARQVLGATAFSGTSENPILFLKEISSNGNFQTVDVIFPSFPFFLYTNPRWLAYLLEPLIEHMLSGQYPNNYSMHDLGSHYPNATGHPDGKDEYMPVEECGNMLIMGLALVNSLRYPHHSIGTQPKIFARDDPPTIGIFPLLDFQNTNGVDRLDSPWALHPEAIRNARKWVERSYKLWEQWTGYLVEYSLEPENQLSTDDFAGWLALQTNLALKGIIGINAMSELAQFVGRKEEARFYKNISDTYVAKWEDFGMSRDKTHAKISYNWYGSWTTLYNLYADSLLCFHLHGTTYRKPRNNYNQKPLHLSGDEQVGFVPRHIYKSQSKWYHLVRQKYGLPLDSRHLYAKTDWEFFSMAISSKPVRHEILESVALWLNETVTDHPFTDLHKTEDDGGYPGPNFYARPVVGGHFAFLALQRACGGRAMAGLDFLNEEDIDEKPPPCEGDKCSEDHDVKPPPCGGDECHKDHDEEEDYYDSDGEHGSNTDTGSDSDSNSGTDSDGDGDIDRHSDSDSDSGGSDDENNNTDHEHWYDSDDSGDDSDHEHWKDEYQEGHGDYDDGHSDHDSDDDSDGHYEHGHDGDKWRDEYHDSEDECEDSGCHYEYDSDDDKWRDEYRDGEDECEDSGCPYEYDSDDDKWRDEYHDGEDQCGDSGCPYEYDSDDDKWRDEYHDGEDQCGDSDCHYEYDSDDDKWRGEYDDYDGGEHKGDYYEGEDSDQGYDHGDYERGDFEYSDDSDYEGGDGGHGYDDGHDWREGDGSDDEGHADEDYKEYVYAPRGNRFTQIKMGINLPDDLVRPAV